MTDPGRSRNTLVIIPAFNEAESLPALLESLARLRLGLRVVVIDDGSEDDTSAVALRNGALAIRHPYNLGYGAALQTGYKYALSRGTDFLLQMDADGQHLPEEVPGLLDEVRGGECDLALGSRFLEPSGYRMGMLRSLGRVVCAKLARLGGLRISDPTSGFQAMNLRVLQVYASDFFPTDYPDVDVLLAAYRRGLRVGECPVHMTKAKRESTLHGGLRSVYYVYKMLLSTWSASARIQRRGSRTKMRNP